MSTRQLRGSAAEIEYQPLTGDPIVHLLAVPLLISPHSSFVATLSYEVWTAWSADKKTRETFTLGGPVDEIIGTVRFDDQPRELRELIRAGLMDDAEMIYRPYGPTPSPGPGDFPCKLVAIPGAGEGKIPLAPDRAGFREYTVTLLLRRVDGGDWNSLLDGTAAP